jgi:CrcB protein
MTALWVFIGGGLGSLLRYGFSKLFPFNASFFPWSTLLSNLLAALLLALVVNYFKDSSKWQHVQPFVVIGICGGLSTFSTFTYENFQLLQQGQLTLFWINLLLSFGLSLSLFFVFARH